MQDIPFAEKMEEFADKLESKIKELKREGKTGTNKQRSQQSHRLYEAHNKENARKACLALAEGFRNGTAPDELTYYQHLTKIERATSVGYKRQSQGYHDLVYPDPKDWKDESDLAVSLRCFCFADRTPEEEAKQEAETDLRMKLMELKSSKIDGFFPTPDSVLDEMFSTHVDLTGKKILEPSAGIGSIADYCKQLGAEVVCVERVPQLCEILELKGHTVIQADFLSLKPVQIFDMVVMNPPFEKSAAPKHVAAASQFLKTGPNDDPELMAVMPGTATTYGRSNQKLLQEFDRWVSDNDGHYTDLPADSFKGAFCSTGVNTTYLTMNEFNLDFQAERLVT